MRNEVRSQLKMDTYRVFLACGASLFHPGSGPTLNRVNTLLCSHAVRQHHGTSPIDAACADRMISPLLLIYSYLQAKSREFNQFGRQKEEDRATRPCTLENSILIAAAKQVRSKLRGVSTSMFYKRIVNGGGKYRHHSHESHPKGEKS